MLFSQLLYTMKMKPRITLLSLLSLFILYGCSEDVKEYYYSLEALTTPKYYAYTCKEDSSRSQYWKMSADIENKFLITEAFNSSLEQFEYFKEKFDSNGSQLVEYTMINGEDRTTTTPKSKDVFIWNPEEEYSYSVKYPNDDDQILFRKSRKLIGKESIEIMGKKLDALKFKGTYYYESEKHKESMEYWQFSYYTKEYGFVKYERHVDNGQVITLELTNLLSEEDWNKLK